MKNVPKFINNKNLLIGLIVTIIIAYILNLIMLKPSPEQKTNKNQLLTSGNSTPAKSIPYTPTPTPQIQTVITPDNTWTIGDNIFYTINFPSDWKPDVKAVKNGGSGVTLKPAALPVNYLLPSLHIETTPKDPANPFSERIKFLSPLGFTKRDITFQDIPAVRLSGILPFKPLPENPNKNLIHKEYTFFEKSNNTYIITFAYYMDQDASKNEQLYIAMLKSIKFK